MFIALSIIFGFLLLYFGGELLLKGSVSLAQKAGVSTFVIGLTMVAFGTSSPELVISVMASIEGEGGIAVGNVIGSNICNLALVLGLAAFLKPINTNGYGVFSQAPLLVGVSLLMCLFVMDNEVNRFEGITMFLGAIAYLLYQFYSHRTRGKTLMAIDENEIDSLQTRKLTKTLVIFSAGLILINVGGYFLLEGAKGLATSLSVSTTVIGLTIVALGTSTPELVVCLLAIARKQEGISVGTILGSNFFNILGILGASASIAPLNASDLDWVALVIMILLTIGIFPLMRTRWQLERWEGGLLLSAYTGYMVYLIHTNA